MSDTEYNGWTNYPTWVVKLHIDNEETSYWTRQASDAVGESQGADTDIEERRADRDDAIHQLSCALSDELRDPGDNGSGVPFTGMHADLLGWAFGAVNWREIAESLIDAAIEEEKE